MRDGKMKQAGVGLATLKGPFDQVAKFPSRIYKAEFTTEQVTTEMQGVRVSGMLIWTINRVGDGPFNAYKNLGTDIASQNPTSANNTLTSMSSAIVRNCIANSTIESMLRDRTTIREEIRKEMFDVVKGWGVWLETIEITDVQISSGSLFKDMQSDFREKMKKVSELYMMKIEGETSVIRTKKDLEMQEKRTKINIERNTYEARIDQEIKEQDEKTNKEIDELKNVQE